ncbi:MULTISPECIES: hypothetical protein [unclassified Lysobacter]|uniref:hypothetical protein n=1 Tax=unclassified Lysobacter TaxID=2635362 RepID=UPI001BEB437A|nr:MULTISPECIES: hypothetical protein [unclassified Lysobacter]MBT2747536.1 hypothetical protein [Lysobacter sp. ISL-42]MBT2752359.1 hypothetical protein [Lysobacter sp. ISL-50]MBT2776222.1 hypothetical protein [Lysobacter sp. ISL-54]MBT2784306.1 hypothetical protein [Lysobacter sp. ISL-52]
MDDTLAKDLFDTLVENSSRVLAKGYGIGWAESSLFEVVRLLRQEESLKSYFLERVSSEFSRRAPGVKSTELSTELIELVAHELRWMELLQLAQIRIETVFQGDSVRAVGDISARLASAYDDQWEDREFYKRYRDNSI